MHPAQRAAYMRMTPAEKIELAARIHRDARSLTAAGLRMRHPGWPDERIASEVRRIFLYARG
jgi:hypothetical protein